MWFTAGMVAAILSYTWWLEPRVSGAWVAMPAAIAVALGGWHAWRTGDWGFRWNVLAPALKATTLFTLPIVAAILGAGAALGTLHEPTSIVSTLGVLVVWGGAQQWLLQTLVLQEAQHATSRRAGILLAATLFAAIHLPNPFLTAMTFLGALGWCAIYDRHPNVIPLAISHAFGTLAVLVAFDDAVTGRLRIGLAYLALD
jgi:membrane protease YdiL (CAAX protease family)